MHGTALHGADFTGADLSYAVFDSSKLFGAVFRNADLRLISFYNSIITESVFDGAKLSRSTIVGCVLRNIDLSSADIDIMRTTVDTIYNSDKGAFHNIPGLRIIRESAHTAIPYLDDYESATAFVESLPSAINSDYNRTEPEGGRNP
jgi:hypothetical protein